MTADAPELVQIVSMRPNGLVDVANVIGTARMALANCGDDVRIDDGPAPPDDAPILDRTFSMASMGLTVRHRVVRMAAGGRERHVLFVASGGQTTATLGMHLRRPAAVFAAGPDPTVSPEAAVAAAARLADALAAIVARARLVDARKEIDDHAHRLDRLCEVIGAIADATPETERLVVRLATPWEGADVLAQGAGQRILEGDLLGDAMRHLVPAHSALAIHVSDLCTLDVRPLQTHMRPPGATERLRVIASLDQAA